jgi:hypothetical protein
MHPAEKPSEPAKPEAKPTDDNIGTGVGCAFVIGLMFLGTIFMIPHTDAEKAELETAADARAAIVKTLSQSYPTADVQVKQLGGFNLELWISKKNFESISYLDRKGVLETVGRGWCESYGGWECPTITVRDEKSGKELGSYHCLFSYAKIEEQ